MSVPVTVVRVWLATESVLTAKVAELLPAGTVTALGTLAAELLEDRLTTSPPDGAGPLRVAVPVLELRPMTLVGLSVMD